jgi:hypothetical protein
VKATTKELGAIKSPTSKTWTKDKAPGNARNNVEQQIAVQDQVMAKWRKAEKRLVELVSKGVGYVPRDSHDDPDLKPVLPEIQAEVDEFTKLKAGVDKDNTEANDHLKRLLAQLT